MSFKHRSLILLSAILYVSPSIASFCSELSSKGDMDTPCFLEPPTFNPALIRSSSHSLILPCHVARAKHSTVEWWYTDFGKMVNTKIYPAFPAVRPTALRFITSISAYLKNSNETDVVDASVLLRSVNVDDSGVYRCVIRPWSPINMNNVDYDIAIDDVSAPTLSYHVELTGPRHCQGNPGTVPCFTSMRTSSPTTVDGYQTVFLQCVVQHYNRPASVFWVVGNASGNSVLITDYLASNKYSGDSLRRVFPLSPFDFSIEVTLNRDVDQRSYSCVIDGATGAETTLFTYHVRTLNLEPLSEQTPVIRKNITSTTVAPGVEPTQPSNTTTPVQTLIEHDKLKPQDVEELRHKGHHEKNHSNDDDDQNSDDDLMNFDLRGKSVQKAIDADPVMRK